MNLCLMLESLPLLTDLTLKVDRTRAGDAVLVVMEAERYRLVGRISPGEAIDLGRELIKAGTETAGTTAKGEYP